MFANLLDRIPPVTRHLFLLNVLFFVANVMLQFRGIYLEYWLSVYFPTSAYFHPYQIFTYLFMHSSGTWTHIIFNMIGLLSFGSRIEWVLGSKRFLTFYFICGLGCLFVYFGVQLAYIQWLFWHAGIPLEVSKSILNFIHQDLSHPTVIEDLNNYLISQQNNLSEFSLAWVPAIKQVNRLVNTPLLGASGAIYGILTAFAWFFPNERLLLLIPPIPIRAKYLMLILILISLYLGISNNPNDNTAHVAHLAGILIAAIVLWIWRKKNII